MTLELSQARVPPVMTLEERAASFAAAFPKRAASGAALTVAGGRLHGVWMGGNNFRNKSRMYGSYPPSFLPTVFSLFPDARRVLHLFSGSLTAEQVISAYINSRGSSVHDVRWTNHEGSGGLTGCLKPGCKTPHGDGIYARLPQQFRFDSGTHPAARAAKPDVQGDAETLTHDLDAWAVKLKTLDEARRQFEKTNTIVEPFDLVVADPPYALADQIRYATEAGRWPLCKFCRELKSAHVEDRNLHPTRADDVDHFIIQSVLICPDGRASYKRAKFIPLKKQQVLAECAKVVSPGGHVVWLDCVWPQHSKKFWKTVGIIGLVRSTTHRIRQITILERQ